MKSLPVRLILLASLALALPGFAQMDSHVKASLITPTKTVIPGSTWTVGLRLQHDPHWHTYWVNPGDTGYVTSIDWSGLPAGFVVGEPLWPAPIKFEVGGIVGYGYEGTVVLLFPVKVPETAKPGETVKLEGVAQWLECEESCIPGEAPVSITATVGTAEEPTEDAALIRRFEARVPQPIATQAGVTVNVLHTTAPKKKGDAFAVNVEITGGGVDPTRASQVDFYPLPSEAARLDGEPATFRLDAGFGITLKGALAAEVSGPTAEVAGVLKYFISGQAEPQHHELRVNVLSGTAPIKGAPAAPPFTLRGLLAAVLFALIGGLILNIMPCVLPVISLKVFSLVKQSRESRARLLLLGAVYSLGVLVSFWILAGVMIAIKARGDDATWGALFQYPVFVILMTAVVYALGLSMFGVYEISAPSGKTVQELAGLQEKEGPVGAFFMGVLATVLATPCSAPFLGAAIAFAIPQPSPVILAIFTAVGAGLALPFLVLSAFPAWTRFIPKPGLWMMRFKEVMGFLLMATAIWLLYVVGKLLGVEGVAWTLSFLLAVGLGCWMIGSFIDYTSSRARRVTVWALALLVATAGYGYFVHLYLHPREHDNAIQWIAYSPEKLAELRADKKLVFVDATAEWCLTCKANEKLVIETDAVRAKFAELGVVALRADFTRKDAIVAELLSQFNRRGVPLYVIYPNNGRPPIALPEAITPGMVIETLEQAS